MKAKVLVIFLVCLILVLSILDAPEFVRCSDIGICEFLELHGLLGNILKSDIMIHICFVETNNFSSILENLINKKELIQNLIFSSIPAVLKSFKISITLIKRELIVLASTEHKFPLIENNLSSQNLKLIGISVIRS